MSESKHTPGPWTACNGGRCQCKIVSCKDHPIAKAFSLEWGDPGLPYGYIDEGVAVANARLIAAAPDLLAACERAEQTIRNLAGGGWIREGDGVTIAMNESSNLRAAIHAAKGVEP